MDLRLTFNTAPEEYDNLRPRYVDALFADVIQLSGLDATTSALEIGIGTGQATLPFLKTGCEITAIEIGDKLAQYSREKFSEYNRFTVVNQDFESVLLENNTYDLIYSASAFHWIPPEVGLPKVYRLLKPGGVFAWFANHPCYAKEHVHIHEAFQIVYGKRPEFGKPGGPYTKEQSQKRIDLIKSYGFVEASYKWYHNKRTYNAKDYVRLLGTFSDHIALPEEIRLPFFREIADVINRYGGRFSLEDTVDLCIARKP